MKRIIQKRGKRTLPLKTVNLGKKFGSFKAVSKVNLRIKPGEIYAVIGPNGAGKTTLIKMIVGLLSPTKGKVFIFGIGIEKQPLKAKQMFGYIPDNPDAYQYLTGYEFLLLAGSLNNLSRNQTEERITQLLPIFPINDIINQPIAQYSRGNKQKLAFIAAVLPNPKLLIIDEPIVGLDPASIQILGNQLRGIAAQGGSVFFVTHILSFAQQYADRVGIMVKGRIVDEQKITKNLDLNQWYQQKVSQNQ